MFHSIENVEVSPKDFPEFELFLKSSYQMNSYLLQYIHVKFAENYVRAIEILFEQDDTMTLIQNKMQETFPLDTQDVMTQFSIAAFFTEINYSLPFVISDSSCILNDKINSSLKNDFQTSENELENMKVDREISTLISFSNNKKLLTNGFIS